MVGAFWRFKFYDHRTRNNGETRKTSSPGLDRKFQEIFFCFCVLPPKNIFPECPSIESAGKKNFHAGRSVVMTLHRSKGPCQIIGTLYDLAGNFARVLHQGVLFSRGGAPRPNISCYGALRPIYLFPRPAQKGGEIFLLTLLFGRGLWTLPARDPVGRFERCCRVKYAPLLGLSGGTNTLAGASGIPAENAKNLSIFVKISEGPSVCSFCVFPKSIRVSECPGIKSAGTIDLHANRSKPMALHRPKALCQIIERSMELWDGPASRRFRFSRPCRAA